MKILIVVSIVIASIIAIALITALFVKKEYSVERSIIINKPIAEVFDYIKLLKNQNNYSVWAKVDTSMKKEYSGVDGTVGFISGWDSENKNVGKGEQEIVKITNGQRIDYELRFMKPFKAVNPAFMRTETISDTETNVVWGFNGRMNYPMNLMLLIMNIEQMIGNDFENGLKTLKDILEKP